MKNRKNVGSIAMSTNADAMQRTSLPPVAQPRSCNYASLTTRTTRAEQSSNSEFNLHHTAKNSQDATLCQTLPSRRTIPQYSSVNHLYENGSCDSSSNTIHQPNHTSNNKKNNKINSTTNDNAKKVNTQNMTLPTAMSSSWSSSFSSLSPHHNAQANMESKKTQNSASTRINTSKTLPPISTERTINSNFMSAKQSPLHSITSTRAKMHNVHSFLSFNTVHNTTSIYNSESNNNSSGLSNVTMSRSDMKFSKTDKPALSFSANSPLTVNKGETKENTLNRRNSVKELTSMLSLHTNTSSLRKKLLRCHRLANPEDALNLKSAVPEVEWYIKPAASSSSLLLLRQEDAAEVKKEPSSPSSSLWQGQRSSVYISGSNVNEQVKANRQSEAARHERILLSLMSPKQRAIKEESARLAAEAAEHKEVQRRKRIRSFLAPVVSPTLPDAQKLKKTTKKASKSRKDKNIEKSKSAELSTRTAPPSCTQEEQELELVEERRKRKKEKRKEKKMKKEERRKKAEAKLQHSKEDNYDNDEDNKEQQLPQEEHEKHVHHKHRHRHKKYDKEELLEKEEEKNQELQAQQTQELEIDKIVENENTTRNVEQLHNARKKKKEKEKEEGVEEENQVQDSSYTENKVEKKVKHHHRHHRSSNKKEKTEKEEQPKSDQETTTLITLIKPLESTENDTQTKESHQESEQNEENKLKAASSSSSSSYESRTSTSATTETSSWLSEEGESTLSSRSSSNTSDTESEDLEEEEEEEEEELEMEKEEEEEEENVNYDDETVAEKKERIEIEVLCYFHELRHRRTKAALTIQCAWRVHCARMELHTRQQILYYHVYKRQRAAGLCIASWYKTHLLQKAYKTHKENLEVSFVTRAEYEQKLIHSIRVIERNWVKCAWAFRQRRELCIRLKLSKIEELNVFRRAAIILQRWWRLIVPVKAYWVQRRQEVHNAHLLKLREEEETQAINTIQCVLQSYNTHLQLIKWKKEKQEKRKLFMSRVRAATDVIDNVFKEYYLRRHRLAREHMANQLASLEHIQQEWKEALGRRVLVQYVEMYTSMEKAACLIQHQWRMYSSGREKRYLREVSRTITSERIEFEFVYYRAIITLQNFARLVLFKKRLVEIKAQKGRMIIESIWLMQRTGRGKLNRAALSNMHMKHIKEIEEAKQLAAHLSEIRQITLRRVAETRQCVLKELITHIAKEVELQKLKEIALRELHKDHCASVIQRAWRRHVKRIADVKIKQERDEASQYIHRCILKVQCAWMQYKARKALRAKLIEKKCYENTRGLHEEMLHALYYEQLIAQVAHTQTTCSTSSNQRERKSNIDCNDNTKNEIENVDGSDNDNDDPWALVYDIQ